MCYFLFAIMSLSILYIVSVKFIQCSLCQLTTVNDVETSTGRANRLPSYQEVSGVRLKPSLSEAHCFSV